LAEQPAAVAGAQPMAFADVEGKKIDEFAFHLRRHAGIGEKLG
jgi:hypothetical protein